MSPISLNYCLMNVLSKVVDWILHPQKIIFFLVRNVFSPLIPDKLYLRVLGRLTLGYWMNLDNPITFNEKMNWLKLHDRNPDYYKLVDKIQVKRIVSDLVGSEYVVPLIGVWDNVDDIDFNELPNKCILKTNQDSGGAIRFDKQKIKGSLKEYLLSVRKNLNSRMHLFNYYYFSREWPYRNVDKKIFAEELLEDAQNEVLRDYKFWCFNGNPMIMYVTIKDSSIFENFYDMDFQPIYIDHGSPRQVPEFERPSSFDEMKALARKLSQGIPFVRIDFFYVGTKVFFGEYTFLDWGGFRAFGDNWDFEIGKLLELEQ